MQSCEVFIIAWTGHHQRAIKIASQLSSSFNVSIVYSGPKINRLENINLIRRPNKLFWGDKFRACVNSSKSDLMFVIHADCIFNDWNLLVKKAIKVMCNSNIGVWAPYFQTPSKPLSATFISSLEIPHLVFSAWVDSLIFCLKKPIIERMKNANYDENIFGWGISYMFTACAISKGLITVYDTTVRVNHLPGRGYSSSEAIKQRDKFLNQLTISEKQVLNLLFQIIKRNEIILENGLSSLILPKLNLFD